MPNFTPDHRRFTRIPFAAVVTVHAGAKKWQCELLDVSLKGMLASAPPDTTLTIGQPVTVELRLEGGGAGITAGAIVRHLEAGRAGFGLDHLDVDSATHLRRLIELNLADDTKLHRELAAMISAS
jgi:hypothetical protein